MLNKLKIFIVIILSFAQICYSNLNYYLAPYSITEITGAIPNINIFDEEVFQLTEQEKTNIIVKASLLRGSPFSIDYALQLKIIIYPILRENPLKLKSIIDLLSELIDEKKGLFSYANVSDEIKNKAIQVFRDLMLKFKMIAFLECAIILVENDEMTNEDIYRNIYCISREEYNVWVINMKFSEEEQKKACSLMETARARTSSYISHKLGLELTCEDRLRCYSEWVMFGFRSDELKKYLEKKYNLPEMAIYSVLRFILENRMFFPTASYEADDKTDRDFLANTLLAQSDLVTYESQSKHVGGFELYDMAEESTGTSVDDLILRYNESIGIKKSFDETLIRKTIGEIVSKMIRLIEHDLSMLPEFNGQKKNLSKRAENYLKKDRRAFLTAMTLFLEGREWRYALGCDLYEDTTFLDKDMAFDDMEYFKKLSENHMFEFPDTDRVRDLMNSIKQAIEKHAIMLYGDLDINRARIRRMATLYLETQGNESLRIPHAHRRTCNKIKRYLDFCL